MTQSHQPIKESRLDDLKLVGNGSVITEQVGDLISKTELFGVLDRLDINLLASYMSLYKAKDKDIIITEGEDGDYMLLVVEGSIDVLKQDAQHCMKHITTIKPGTIVGEMAVIDGGKRFATCITSEPSVLAVLTRDALVQIIDNEPKLGAKILVQLLAMMSEHLRETGGKLVGYLRV